MRPLTLALLLVGLAPPVCALAQVVPPTQQQQEQQQQPEDTIPVPPFRFDPPISPLGAFARSFLLPGWGQAVLGRRATGALFVAWEGLTATMVIKSVHQLHYQESIDAETVEDKKKEVQDWLVLLVFNHLLAGTEAYVSALMWDFPTDLNARVLPGGEISIGLSLRWSPAFD
ncbi:MAG: hypothetical protein JSW71_23780 [Gemmatimonadota bacterium]|nr:MAG: hypothetical protein JSW71_23780 [Gemmatimonadota bacterium]